MRRSPPASRPGRTSYARACISCRGAEAGSIAAVSFTFRFLLLLPCWLASIAPAAAQGCPVESNAGALLVVEGPDRVRIAFDDARLAALPAQRRVQRRSVGGSASAPAVEQDLRYDGVRLRDVIEQALPELLKSRTARRLVVQAVATDRYVAVFSWGELFNSEIGEHVLVVRAQDGRPLGADAGPLALRSLADLRPGPRHVRNLCAVLVQPAGGP